MRVFVATKEGQGGRTNDFSWTKEGEYVTLGFECDSDSGPDDNCGCHRSFCGVKSLKATTTAKVVEKRITTFRYRDIILGERIKAGWTDLASIDREYISSMHELADELMEIASGFPVGAIVEKRGDSFQIRR